MQQKNDFFSTALELMSLGNELYAQAKKGEKHFYNYCMENKEQIISRLDESKKSNATYEELFKVPFIKNNFTELSDYVVRYYDAKKRTK
jgi:gamma-glutamylcyclotransferase (GGCT)/AIG2-like uncharacterized protein YtfP